MLFRTPNLLGDSRPGVVHLDPCPEALEDLAPIRPLAEGLRMLALAPIALCSSPRRGRAVGSHGIRVPGFRRSNRSNHDRETPRARVGKGMRWQKQPNTNGAPRRGKKEKPPNPNRSRLRAKRQSPKKRRRRDLRSSRARPRPWTRPPTRHSPGRRRSRERELPEKPSRLSLPALGCRSWSAAASLPALRVASRRLGAGAGDVVMTASTSARPRGGSAALERKSAESRS